MSKKSRKRRRLMERQMAYASAHGSRVSYPPMSESEKNTYKALTGKEPTTYTQTSVRGHRFHECHLGPQYVMTIGNVDIWGAAYRDVKNDFTWDYILRFGDWATTYINPEPIVSLNPKAKAMFDEAIANQKRKNDPAIIDVYWEDFNSPDLSKEWWQKLDARIKSLPKGNMVVHCFGGHGRTGTALAILAGLNNLTIQGDPVKYVRAHYCTSAVESAEQIKYIKDMTGLEFTSTFKGWMSSYLQQKDALDKSKLDTNGHIIHVGGYRSADPDRFSTSGMDHDNVTINWSDYGVDADQTPNKFRSDTDDYDGPVHRKPLP